MSQSIAAVAGMQSLVVGALLAWSGVWKLASPQALAGAARSALTRLLRDPRVAVVAFTLVGGIETITAALLLAPPFRPWAMRLATVLATGFVGYLIVAWRVAPDKPCACMGGRATTISRRSLARALALLALTLFGWLAASFWVRILLASPWVVAVVVIEWLALVELSPEFGWRPSLFIRRMWKNARLARVADCETIDVPRDALLRQVRQSDPFARLAASLADVTDHWREGCWSFIAFAATYEGRAATAVFAVPVVYDAAEVGAAVVDDADDTILLLLGSTRALDTSLPGRVGREV